MSLWITIFAEQAVRPFTLGRKNWVNVTSLRGAEASAILYSIVETAKANNLRIYDYLKLILSELVNHSDDSNQDYLEEIMPWSKSIQKKVSAK